jgi:hypothetical protein
MEHCTVSALLSDLVESAPPSDVDIQRAAADGRRRIRRRRVLVGASAALATGVVVLVTMSLVGGAPLAVPEPVTGGESATPTVTSPTSPAPYTGPHFNPLAQYADFGWLPDGLTGSTLVSGRDWLSVTAQYHASATPDPSPSGAAAQPGVWGDVTLIVTTGGFQVSKIWPYSLAVDPAAPDEPAQPVSGHPARWLTAGPVALRWHYKPDVWAAVVVDMHGVDTRALAARIAADVQYDVNRPLLLPFHTSGLPGGLPVAMITLAHNGAQSTPPWNGEIDYGTGPGFPEQWPLSIDVVPTTPELDRSTVSPTATGEHPNTTVGGYPAHTDAQPDGGTMLTVYNVDGTYVRITTHSPQATASLTGGLEGLFLSTQFLGDPTRWR